MSHYVRSRCRVRSRAALVAALVEMGFRPEVSDAPVALVGWHGDERADRAHVVIRRAQLWSMSNDIGFVELADGSFEAIVSEFDRRSGVRDPIGRTSRYAADAWEARVAHLSGVHADLQEADALGLVAERVDAIDDDGVPCVDVYVYAKEG